MRNLFLFLWRNNFTLMFLFLESICVYLLVKNNSYQSASYFNATNKVVISVNESVNYVKEYLNLRSNNEYLTKENALLRNQLSELTGFNPASSIAITDTFHHQQYSYVPAKIINNTVNRRNNFLTLNRGFNDSIRNEMAVISSNGIIGIVKDVSPHFCTVMSVLHKDMKVSVRFKKNNYFGSLVWNGGEPRIATLLDIAKHVTFTKGDTIVTTAYSSIFPEGIMVGTVANSAVKSGDNFYTIDVLLSTNFNNVSSAYVVRNLYKEEQKKLEATQAHDN